MTAHLQSTLVSCVLAVPLALLGCADHAAPATSPPAASPPAAAASEAPRPDRTTATTEADAGEAGPLERDAARLDAAMRRARDRIDAGGQQVNVAARDELTALEKRYAVVRGQLHDLEQKTDQRADTVRREAKTAADDLRKDLDRLADRLTH